MDPMACGQVIPSGSFISQKNIKYDMKYNLSLLRWCIVYLNWNRVLDNVLNETFFLRYNREL